MASTEEQLDYMDAIEAALTHSVWQRVSAFARRRCQLLSKAGLPADPEELTMSAISDTTLGEREWKPDQCALHVHLCGVIRSRTSAAIERSLRVRYVPVGGRSEGVADRVEEAVVAAAPRQSNPEAELIHGDLARQTVAALTALASESNDRQVLQILEAWGEGLIEREGVANHLGISIKKCKNARERLMRMADKLPEELRWEATP